MVGRLKICAGILLVLTMIVGPAIVGVKLQAQTRSFRVVRDGVLYRSGQMTPAGMRRVLNDYGIRTVVCLRDGTTASDQATEAVCRKEEVYFVRIMPNAWGDVGWGVPAAEGVRKFHEVMSEPRNYPVLLHCFAGVHRTGIFTAIYRMEFEHWTNADAMQEMRSCGYTELDEHLDVLGYLEGYRPAWKGPAPRSPDGPHAQAPDVPEAVRILLAKYAAQTLSPVETQVKRKARRKQLQQRGDKIR